jgi:hypothetical protein
MVNTVLSILVPIIAFFLVFVAPIKIAYFWCSRSLHGTRRKTFGGVSLLLGAEVFLLFLKNGDVNVGLAGTALGIFGVAILSWSRDPT